MHLRPPAPAPEAKMLDVVHYMLRSGRLCLPSAWPSDFP